MISSVRRAAIVLCVGYTILVARTACAQVFLTDEESRVRVGAAADVAFNLHSADFTGLPGIPNCCPNFGSGSGIGPDFGAFIEYQLTHSLSVAMRASYASRGAVLSADEPTFVSVNNVNTPGTLHHVIDATLNAVGIEPAMVFRIGGRFSVSFGVDVGYMITTQFHQYEQVASPGNAVFYPSLLTVRNDTSGAIPQASTIESWIVGRLRYEFPLNAKHSLMMAPEVSVHGALSPVISGVSWHAHAIHAGVAVIYTLPTHPPEAPPPPPPPPPLPPVVQPPVARTPEPPQPAVPPPTANLSVIAVDDDGTQHPGATIRIEEYIMTRTRPLLPFVFFDDQSSALPQRYAILDHTQSDTFQMASLHDVEMLPMYRHVLNIVGHRMRAQPAATLTLTGCNNDRGAERGNRALSMRRAETVRAYLHDVWGIADSRLRVVARDLPSNPTNVDSAYGYEENRRVEMRSDSPELLAPIVTAETLRVATPPKARFAMHASGAVSHWSLQISQDTQHFAPIGGTSTPASSFDWTIPAARIHTSEMPIIGTLDVVDTSGRTAESAPAALPINIVTIQHKRERSNVDTTIDEYGLILFDFDKADLSPANRVLCRYIGEHINPTSIVHVDGYSDHYGDPEHNITLSQDRARVVGKALGVPAGNITGRGDGSALFPNDTPEGRFYCRTVRVRVETPVRN